MKILVYHLSGQEKYGELDADKISEAYIDTYNGQYVPHCYYTDSGKQAMENTEFMMVDTTGFEKIDEGERDTLIKSTTAKVVAGLKAQLNAST